MKDNSKLYLMLAGTLVLFVAYTSVLLVQRDHIKKLDTPFTYIKSDIYRKKYDAIVYTQPVADLTADILLIGGCSEYAYRNVYRGEYIFTAATSAPLCKCLYDYVANATAVSLENEDQRKGNVMKCITSFKPPMTKGLLRVNNFWISNPLVLVWAWNAVSLLALLFASMDNLNFKLTSVGKSNKPESSLMKWGTILLFLAVIMLPFGIAGASHVNWSSLWWHLFFSVLGFTAVCMVAGGMIDEKLRENWMFLFHSLFVLPMAIIIYNISLQRRDVIFMLSCFFFSTAICLSGWVTAVFGHIMQRIENSDNHKISKTMQEWKANLGVDYSRIGNYVSAISVVLIASLSQLAYPTITPQQTLNFQAVSGISLLVLLIAIVMRNGVSLDDKSTASARFFLEFVARTLLTGACMADLFSLA